MEVSAPATAREILVDDVRSVEAQVAQLRVRIRAVLVVAGVIVTWEVTA